MDKILEDLIIKVKKYNPDSNFSLIEKAYEFAKKYHSGQTRDSGEPFVNHPVEVAKILTGLEMNSKTIAAGILHDVIEDTKATYEEVALNFGTEIAQMVDGVTTLSMLNFDTKKEYHIENIRKMFLAMSKDIRVIIIKLSDRLHNMRTLNHTGRDRQLEKAKETLEIYAPIAHRLGMSAFKWELEDLAFKYIFPEEYYNLAKQIASKRKEREEYINRIIDQIKRNLSEKNIRANVDGRIKHLYSIYQKMNEQSKELEQIYDLFALRIIVNSINDCYSSLGLVHEMYRPVPGRFKDYIAMPKNNMYQSLHTTLIGHNGITFEVQIRTWQMHQVSEYGIAAHWKYKEGARESSNDIDSKLAWLRQLVEWQKDIKDSDEFYDTLKIDLFDDEVFIFTPKGDVKNLPAGSTPIDFAYSIHSAIGNKMTGAKINGKIEPLTYKLQNGDIVDIITSSSSKGPSLDWLKVAKSSQAKNKIKQFFKKEKREENIEKGKESIERELKRQGLSFNEIFKPQYYEEMLRRYNFTNIEDMFCAIGYSGISSNKVISKLKEEYRRQNKDTLEQEEEKTVKIDTNKRRNEQGVIVKGITNCLVKISRCCNPVPGDDIIGYITRGRGVTVHRKDCINVINNKDFEYRLIDVKWAKDINESYSAEVTITCYDRNNILAEITKSINDIKIPINSLDAKTNRDGTAVIRLRLQISDKEELSKVIKTVKRINGIIEIARSNRRLKNT